MKQTLNAFTIIISTLLISCMPLKKGYIKFDAKNIEPPIVSPNMSKFLKENPNPSIVLRVPKASGSTTQEDKNSYIYTAIEKELIIAGFNVKDRSLYEEVLNKSSENTDYAKINQLTGTDLILELVKVNPEIPFSTNRVFMENDKETIIQNFVITKYGTDIEFKLVMVKNNECGAFYSFIGTPCAEKNNSCDCKVAYKEYNPVRFYNINNCTGVNNVVQSKVKKIEIIPENNYELFIRKEVKKMIQELKK